jgi:hypothetical protein
MSDLNWCTSCDNAISPFSESLYCSEQCLRADALRNHPLLGYTYPEFTDFPRPKPVTKMNNSIPSIPLARQQQPTTSNILSNTSLHQASPKLSYSNYSSATTSPALTATSSTSSDSSSQFSSPPKFDLLSNSATLPPVTTKKLTTTNFNYFSIFDSNSTTVVSGI